MKDVEMILKRKKVKRHLSGGVNQREAQQLLLPFDSDDSDSLAWLRLAWCALAMGSPLEPFLSRARGTGPELLSKLGPCDLRPLQQLAWHRRSEQQNDALRHTKQYIRSESICSLYI